MPAPPFYLSGLDLRGRRVLVAGAGAVAARRLPALLRAGALVEVVAPEAEPVITELARSGGLVWHQRPAAPSDIAGAWYVMAATNSPATNRELARCCEEQRIFCVRCDDATGGTARTPAAMERDDFWVAVLGHRDPHGSKGLRQRIARALDAPDES